MPLLATALRSVGVCMTVLASGAAGLRVAESYRARERELSAWITALTTLETEISYGAVRLPQAMRRAGAAAGGVPGLVLGRAADLLDDGELGGAGQCIRAALEQEDAGGEKDDLGVLGDVLGTSGAADQARHIALAIQRLERRRCAAAEAASRNIKVWSAMGFLIGGMAAISLL